MHMHACMHAWLLQPCSPHTVAGQSLLAVGMHVCACCVRRAGRGLPWPPSPSSRPSQTTHPATKLASLGRRARGCGSDRSAGPHPCMHPPAPGLPDDGHYHHRPEEVGDPASTPLLASSLRLATDVHAHHSCVCTLHCMQRAVYYHP